MTTLTNHNISPRYTGAISPVYPVVLNDDNGPLDLTGCTPGSFTLTLWDINNSANIIVGTGAWTVTDALKGKATYQWSRDDLAVPGVYHVYTTVHLPSEPGIRAFDPDLIIVSLLPPGALPMAEQDVNLNQVNGTAHSSSNPLFAQVVNSSAIAVSGTVTVGNASVATTQADGANVAVGATGDSAYAGTGAASLVAILKALYAQMARVSPSSVATPYGSNPTSTGSATEVQFKWGAGGTTQVNHLAIQNKTGSDAFYQFDAAANTSTYKIPDGATHTWDVPVTSLHIYTASSQSINGSSSATNLVITGWL